MADACGGVSTTEKRQKMKSLNNIHILLRTLPYITPINRHYWCYNIKCHAEHLWLYKVLSTKI